MTESLRRTVEELRMRGVRIAVDGENLVIEAARDVLTEDDRSTLRSEKAAFLAYLERNQSIISKIGAAMTAAEEKFPGRFDWGKSNPGVVAATDAVDRAAVAYVEGKGTVTAVERAWKAYLNSIDTRKKAL